MEAEVYTQVKTSIKRLFKIDLEHYKDEQMKRRLDSWLVRSHTPTWQDYFAWVSKDAIELERFRNYLTINVTEFFRDPARWENLHAEILPPLLKTAAGEFKVWSAGCSIGTEAYSLAMLLAEVAPARKLSLLATDLDRGALTKARQGGPYSQDDIRNLTPAQARQYLNPQPPYFVTEKLRQRVRFEEQDLLLDRFESGFDLIVCRNVVIYFTSEAKEKLYAKFSAALRPGGVLFVGGTEIISGPAKYGLQNFGISFYRKP